MRKAFCLGAGTVALRRAARRVAGATPPAVLAHRAEEGHLGSAGDPRLRADCRRSGTSRLPVPAHGRRRARHESEALEFVESVAVLRTSTSGRKRALRRGLESPLDQEQLVAEVRGGRPRRMNARLEARRGAGRRGLDAVQRRVFPAAHASGDRVAHQAARGAGPRRIINPGGRAITRPSAAATRC